MSGISVAFPIILDWEQIASALPSLIETLIVAKLSALAIIFSATFIVSQLVNRRYSAEFTNYFVESDLFRTSLFTSICIIVGDIILLLVFSGLSPDYALYASTISVVFLFIFMAIIYYFVSEMLSKTTPAELLKSFANSLTTQSYIDQCVSAKENDSKNLHPLQPVYDTARNSIQNGELAVAEVAERQMQDICLDVTKDELLCEWISLPQENGRSSDITIRQQNIHLLFKTPFDHYFSSLAQAAVNEKYDSLAQQSVLSISELGQSGSSCIYDELVDVSFVSIYNKNIVGLSDDVTRSSSQYSRLEAAVQGCMDLLKSTIKEDSLELYCQLNTLSYEIVRSVDAQVEKSGFDEKHPIFTIIESQIECYELLVETHRRVYETSELDLPTILGNTKSRLSIGQYSGFENPDPRISALVTCRTLIFAATSQYLYKSDWLDDETVVSHAISSHWRDWIVFSTNNPPRADGVLIAQRYIEMIVHHAIEDEIDLMRHSVTFLSTLMEDGDFTVIEDAFKQIYNWEDRDYDIHEYNSYRGIGRHIVWTTLPWSDYSDEFIELTKEFHIRAKAQYYRRLKNRSFMAARNYIDRKARGDDLPHPADYRMRKQSDQEIEIGPMTSTYFVDSD